MALAASGTEAERISHIIVGTVSGDAAFPATACLVQRALGIRRAMAFDVSAACSGFLYGLRVAQGLLALEPDATVLLVGAEVFSRRVNWKDRSTCVLFGDGAGAAVLDRRPAGPESGGIRPLNAVVEGVLCDGDGRHSGLLSCRGGGTDPAYRQGDVVGPEYFLQMDGRAIFRHAVRSMSGVCGKLLRALGYGVEDIDLVVPHQANLRIVNAVAERLGTPEDKVFVNLREYGNTSAASIPMALAEALEQGAIRPGMRVLLATFGSGLTWGAAVVKF
jgi:3-oxoacyl-[acyl-carrier-protein] synthase-3